MTVHVLRTRLDRDERELVALLDAAERERANRYLLPYLRRRFIAARAFLRTTLAAFLDEDPCALQFVYGSMGKPALARETPLRFNLSHSEELAVLAISWEREVGVDVECVRPSIEHEGLARRFFSPREVDWLLAHAPEQRPTAFFECWTAKEAYIKARGDGLGFPLDAFHALPGEGSRIDLAVYGDRDESARWSLRRVVFGDAPVAVAAEGHDWEVVEDGPAARPRAAAITAA